MKTLLTVDSEDKIAMSLTAGEHLSEMPEAEVIEIAYLNGGITAVTQKNRISTLLKNPKNKNICLWNFNGS